jgi:menaquinone-specific isochorismate synthase
VTRPARQYPALRVETEQIDDVGPLIRLLDAREPLLWMRRGFGLVGLGCALRLEFTGPDRLADAAAAWREVAACARVVDPLGTPGTGLVALGSFAFSDQSAATSLLVVPSIVIGRRAGRSWITRIGAGDLPPAPDLSSPSAVGDPDTPATEFQPGELSPSGYLTAVTAAIGSIRRHELSKVVLAREVVGQLPPGADLRGAIDALGSGYPDCWTYAVDGLVGSSPETLVSVDHGTASARVLAGSAARGADAASDQDAAVALATSAKDQDEHEYAVQNVLASLRRHSADVTASEVPFTLKLPNLWHLASDVEGTLADGSSSLDLLAALHPTAAVAGTPTTAALDLIEELEPFDRGRYAGPVGWVGADGDGEWAIALRCAQVATDGTVTAHAGAGIVAESIAEHELVETRMKFRPIIEAFS